MNRNVLYCLALLIAVLPVQIVLAESQEKSTSDQPTRIRSDRTDFEAMQQEQLARVEQQCAAVQGAARKGCEWKHRYMRRRLTERLPQYQAVVERKEKQAAAGGKVEEVSREKDYLVISGQEIETSFAAE